MNPGPDPRAAGNMHDPFAPTFQEQRLLTEQIHQTQQHLAQLHHLATSTGLESQPNAVDNFRKRLPEHSNPAWGPGDPQLLRLLHSGLDARDKSFQPEPLDGGRQYALQNISTVSTQEVLPSHHGMFSPRHGFPMLQHMGAHAPPAGDVMGMDMVAPSSIPPTGSRTMWPPTQESVGGVGVGMVYPQRVVGHTLHEVGGYREGPSARPQLTLEHSPSGIHMRLPPAHLRPPLDPGPPSSLPLAPSVMPAPLVSSLMRGRQDGPDLHLGSKRLGPDQQYPGVAKARKVAIGMSDTGLGLPRDSLICRHGAVWAHCPDCGGGLGQAGGAAGTETGTEARAGTGVSEGTTAEGRGELQHGGQRSGGPSATKCEHGRQRSRCKECGGSGVCPHNRQRGTCKECRGSQICPHSRRRSLCKDCGGSQICAHGRQRSYCKDCKGSGICEHNRRRSSCKECGGSGICVHGRLRRQCKDCGGSSICPHGRQRSLCKECGGSQICEHGKRKKQCRQCNPQLAEPASSAAAPSSTSVGAPAEL